MRFGLHAGQHQVSFGELLELWQAAARWGFDACYVFDHFVPLYSEVEAFLPEEALSPEGACLEGTVALAALARKVRGVGVGIMVAGAGYRNLGLFIHTVATMAQAAPGRLEIGIGAGWFEPEYRMFGIEFEAPRRRLDRLEQALEAFAAWRRGESVRAEPYARPSSDPKRAPSASCGSVDVPAVRLWVAGTGARRLIPLAARYADSWNAMYLTPEEFRAKVDVLRASCERADRDPESVECSIALRAFCAPSARRARRALESFARTRGREPTRIAERSLLGDPAACRGQIARYAEAGATHVAVMVHPPYDFEALELLTSEVFPAFK